MRCKSRSGAGVRIYFDLLPLQGQYTAVSQNFVQLGTEVVFQGPHEALVRGRPHLDTFAPDSASHAGSFLVNFQPA